MEPARPRAGEKRGEGAPAPSRSGLVRPKSNVRAVNLNKTYQGKGGFNEMVKSIFAGLNFFLLAVGPPAAINKPP
jgi:hypothetical protein